MSSLSELLKSMGVQLGSEGLASSKAQRKPLLEEVLGGKGVQNPQGETFLIEQFFPLDHRHGVYPLEMDFPLRGIARWAGIPDLSDYPAQSFAFLDTETTGLSGGTGTYAFLIGIGKFEADAFHLAQYFLRDPLEEPAQLYALEEFLSGCHVLVTFNGKTFDAPLLNTRYLSHGWHPPLKELHHLDLLHYARRLWRMRLPSRTLGNLEVQILGAERTDADLPGWMIPNLYFDYLRFGQAEPLKRVIYHNSMDVLSLVVLLRRISLLLEHPTQEGNQYGVDLYTLARLFEDLQQLHTAAELYLQVLNHEDVHASRVPQELVVEALHRLAQIYKQQHDYEHAIPLWEEAAGYHHLQAHIELAMFYEHRIKDVYTALQWTERAIQCLELEDRFTSLPLHNQTATQPWLEKLYHRRSRLEKKLERRGIE